VAHFPDKAGASWRFGEEKEKGRSGEQVEDPTRKSGVWAPGGDGSEETWARQEVTAEKGQKESGERRAERFLSAQADPSHEVKGRKKSACSVGNDDLCGSLIGIEVSSQLCGVSTVGTIWL
jgi:hypothetical protein